MATMDYVVRFGSLNGTESRHYRFVGLTSGGSLNPEMFKRGHTDKSGRSQS